MNAVSSADTRSADAMATSVPSNNTVALNSFLDVNTTSNVGAQLPVARQPIVAPNVVAHATVSGTDEPSLAKRQRANDVTPSSENQDAESAPMPGLLELTEACQAMRASDEHETGNTWTKVLSGLLCVIAVPIAWGYLLDPNRRKKKGLTWQDGNRTHLLDTETAV